MNYFALVTQLSKIKIGTAGLRLVGEIDREKYFAPQRVGILSRSVKPGGSSEGSVSLYFSLFLSFFSPKCPFAHVSLRSCFQKTSTVRLRGTKWECGGWRRGSNDRCVSQSVGTSCVWCAGRRNPRQDIAPERHSSRSTVRISRPIVIEDRATIKARRCLECS